MSPRERRTVLVGLGIVLGAVLGLRVAPRTVAELSARREHLVARRELLLRTKAEIGDARALEDSARVLKRRLIGLAPQLLLGRLEADAMADLAKRVSVAAADARVRVVRTAAVPDSARAGRLHRLSLRVSVEGDAPGLLEGLARVERSDSPLTVADARLTAVDPSSPVSSPEVLEGEFVVRGWYVSPAQ